MRNRTPPSGVSVRTESRRSPCNCGVGRFGQLTEKASLFESVSIWVKGGWKETRGLQRPISGEIQFSESRMASLNPFETKRKKAPSGTSSRVCNVRVADREGFEPSRRFPAYTLSRRAPSTTRPPVRAALFIWSMCVDARGPRTKNGVDKKQPRKSYFFWIRPKFLHPILRRGLGATDRIRSDLQKNDQGR